MKHYLITVVDSLTSKTIKFHEYGKLIPFEIKGKMRTAIVNEYDTPLYIETIHTISIKAV